ncbi:hypothetical protein OKW40_005733 [Paraburkholderia sp. RAU6.4a]|uniref:hypothetical protein n=1 Tax=Paraburkholderia sp. RAU6.4a TaxID=2991067 RepID=UPI003D25EA51
MQLPRVLHDELGPDENAWYAEEAFDPIAYALQRLAVEASPLAARNQRMRSLSQVEQTPCNEWIGIDALLCNEELAAQMLDEFLRTRDVVDASFGSVGRRPACRIRRQMQLGVRQHGTEEGTLRPTELLPEMLRRVGSGTGRHAIVCPGMSGAARAWPRSNGWDCTFRSAPTPLHAYPEQCHIRAQKLIASESTFRHAAYRIVTYLSIGRRVYWHRLDSLPWRDPAI